MGLKAILFDMDGLMIDSEVVTYDGYVIEMGKRNLHFDKDFYTKMLGRSIKEITNLFLKEYGHDFDFQALVKDVHKYVSDSFKTTIPLKKGLLEIIEFAKDNNLKMIVATSSSKQRVIDILATAKLLDTFDDIICGDEVTMSKPEPEIFLRACSKLNVLPAEAVVLEDSEMGILAAFRANINVICVPDMKYPELDFATKTYAICDNLIDAINIIRNELI